MGQCLAPSLVILILILVLVLTAGASFVVKFESAERSVSCVVSLHDVMRCAVLSSFGCSLRTEQPPPPKKCSVPTYLPRYIRHRSYDFPCFPCKHEKGVPLERRAPHVLVSYMSAKH